MKWTQLLLPDRKMLIFVGNNEMHWLMHGKLYVGA